MVAPKHTKARDLEAQEQIVVVEWAHLQPALVLPGMIGDYLFAVPNGGYALKMHLARKMKRMGLKPGVHDLILPIAVAPYHGLFLEMKKCAIHFDYPSQMKKAHSDNQIAFGERMTTAGYCSRLAFGAGEAIEIIQEYLGHGG
jgi:hypothetical protein